MSLPAQDNGNGIVQHGFAKYKRIEINIDVQIMEYGQYGERICGRYQCPEIQCVQKCETAAQVIWHQLNTAVHHATD